MRFSMAPIKTQFNQVNTPRMRHHTRSRYLKTNASLVFGLFSCCLILVLLTHPFMKLPFDPWEHLIKIRSLFDDGKCFLYWPENTSSFCSWHSAWAKLFTLINIDDTFAWAKIIHCTQFFFALLCLFYFSSSVLKLCSKHTPPNSIFLMAIFATLFWLVGNGTYSVDQQQAWIMWYSVTYQGLTIPLFWLITGLTLQLLFNENLPCRNKQVFVLLIISGFLAIAFFHPSEAIYYAIFLFLSLLFTPLISLKQKTVYGGIFFTILPCILFVIATYMKLPFLHGVSIQNGLTDIIQQIELTGKNITENGGNRIRQSFSELAMLSSVAALLFWSIKRLFFYKEKNPISILLVVAVIVFFLIPTSKWLAGITGVLLHENIVWRFFFASPWFLFIPLVIFTITSQCRFPKTYASLFLIASLSVTFVMSQTYFNKTLSGNAYSLYNSFFKERVGLQYSAESLALLEQTIALETKDMEKKDIILYLRSDLATLSRAIWGYYAYSHRRTLIPMHKFYTKQMDQRYTLVPIKLQPDFPKDRNIFLYFRLDAKNISSPQDIAINGNSTILYDLDHIDLGEKYLFIEGWAFLEEQQHESSVSVVLQSDQKTFTFDTSQLFRRDVGKHFRSTQLENSGFLATIKTSDLNEGTYQIGMVVRQSGRKGFVLSERSVTITKKNTTDVTL